MDDVYRVEARERGEPTGRVTGEPMDVGADQSYDNEATGDVDTRVPMGQAAVVKRR